MSNIDIRIAGEADLDAVAPLFEASIREHAEGAGRTIRSDYDWRRETLLRLRRSGSRFLVAFADDKAVGLQVVHYGGWERKSLAHRIRRHFVSLPSGPFLDSKAGVFTDIYVDRDYRGRGIGRALVSAAVELLRTEGIDRAVMDVVVDNEPMLGLARSLDFVPTYNRLVREL